MDETITGVTTYVFSRTRRESPGKNVQIISEGQIGNLG